MDTTNKHKLFNEEQEAKVIDYIKELLDLKFDFSNPNPEVLKKYSWDHYLSYLVIHGQFSNKKGTKRFDTTKERKKSVQALEKILGHAPNSSDLKSSFPTLTQLDDEICQIIDEDLNKFICR